MARRLEVSGLTPEVLRFLYQEELLTETQIGSRFGIGQVQVGRFRRRWGIPTITKSERSGLGLPQIWTTAQQELLIGSLLGDGWMTATSSKSARFSEGHCIEQEAYIRWKAQILGPFVSKLYPTVKKGVDRDYHGLSLATKSCPQLRPFYDLFYPAPEHKRVFPSDLYKRMTPLALAVWYMDDGSLTRPLSHPRIAFGLGVLSLQRAVRALKTLGLKPKVYGKESGRLSIEFPKQAFQFRQLIEPHVPACMAYKLPTETSRQTGDRNARKLTPERAAQLYGGGMSSQEIARVYNLGVSTVGRRLQIAGVVKRKSGPQKASYTLEAASSLLASYDAKEWPNLTQEVQDKWVGDTLRVLRASPFPAPEQFDTESVQVSLGKVQSAEMWLADARVLPIRRVGIGCCTSFFPNRYSAASRGVRTALEAWHLDNDLTQAVRFQFKVGDPVVPHRVLRAVTMRCRTPSVFRPTLAKYVYETYCPPGGAVWDPCAGYGGRLLGACAAGVRYVGTDVESDTIEGNRKLAAALGYPADLHLCPAEEFDPPNVDLVFTSPPYFNRELYSHRDAQSWVRHGDTFTEWVEGFLRPLVKTSFRVSPCLVLNVADIRHRRKVIPLVDTVIKVCLEEGFALAETLYMPLPKLNREDPKEPVLVFRRENLKS